MQICMERSLDMKKRKGTFFWFMGLMGKRLPVYLAAVVLSSAGLAGSRVANAYLIKSITDAAQKGSADGLPMRIFLTFSLFVCGWLLWRFSIVRYNIEGKRGIARVEKMVFSKAMRLPMSYYESHHSGDFMSKLVFDTERAGDIYGSRFRRFADAILASVVYMIPMLILNVRLSGCLFGISCLSFLVNSRFAKPMKASGSKLSGKNAVMTEKLTNILSGMELIKIFPIREKLAGEYAEANEEYSKTAMHTNRLSAGLESLNTFFDLTGALAFLGLGVYFISKNWVELGELTAIYTLYGSFRYMFLDISKYLPQLMNCIANAEKIQEFLAQEEESELESGVESCTYGIGADCADHNTDGKKEEVLLVENVDFAYNKEKQVLDGFSMKVKKGECVAITGKSGCGKSTFGKLLLGFYKPAGGVMKINGKDYRSVSLKEVRDAISYVPQEPYLYNVSIAENIAYGRKGTDNAEVSMEEIIQAAKAANAHDFIMKLPDGYDTIPGERGNKLSGGEKQRIAIARAVIKNASILLLDEATSALDNESERLVNEAVKRISKERTTIMIAHRSSTIAMADRIVEIKG